MEDVNTKKVITIHNKVSNSFRELHVDGAFGGITPKGLFNINFYAERLPIPKATDYQVQGGQLIKISDSQDSKTGMVREFETGVYMTMETARELHKWIGESIAQYDILRNQSK